MGNYSPSLFQEKDFHLRDDIATFDNEVDRVSEIYIYSVNGGILEKISIYLNECIPPCPNIAYELPGTKATGKAKPGNLASEFLAPTV
jgi:hypothetical protein